MTTPSTAPAEMKPAKGSRMTLYIAVAVIVIIIVGAAVYVFTQSSFTPDVTIPIKGNASTGWNVTSIHVSLNQKVRIALISSDGIPHNFVIAYADNATSGTPAAGDLKSADFSSKTTPYNFDFTASTAGTFKFFCMYHYTVMQGIIKIS